MPMNSLSGLWERIKDWLAAAGALLLGILGLWFLGRPSRPRSKKRNLRVVTQEEADAIQEKIEKDNEDAYTQAQHDVAAHDSPSDAINALYGFGAESRNPEADRTEDP